MGGLRRVSGRRQRPACSPAWSTRCRHRVQSKGTHPLGQRVPLNLCLARQRVHPHAATRGQLGLGGSPAETMRGRDRFRTCGLCRLKSRTTSSMAPVPRVSPGQPRDASVLCDPLATAVVRWYLPQACPNEHPALPAPSPSDSRPERWARPCPLRVVRRASAASGAARAAPAAGRQPVGGSADRRASCRCASPGRSQGPRTC
jgi:hypothetical protein